MKRKYLSLFEMYSCGYAAGLNEKLDYRVIENLCYPHFIL